MTEAEAQATRLPDAPVETSVESQQTTGDAQKVPDIGESVQTAEQSEGAKSGREEAVVFGPMTEAEAQATPLPDAPVETSLESQQTTGDAQKAPDACETVERAEGSGGAESGREEAVVFGPITEAEAQATRLPDAPVETSVESQQTTGDAQKVPDIGESVRTAEQSEGAKSGREEAVVFGPKTEAEAQATPLPDAPVETSLESQQTTGDAQKAPDACETVERAEGSGGAESGREEAVVFGPMTEAEAQARGLPDASVETSVESEQETRDAQKVPNVCETVARAERSGGAESGREEAVVFGPMTEDEAQATRLPDAPVETSAEPRQAARDAQKVPNVCETVGRTEGSGGAESGSGEAVVFGPMTEAEAQARGLPDAPVETPAEPRQELRDAQKAPNVGDSVGTAEQSEGAESGREEAVVFGPMTEAGAQATPLPDAPVATSVLSQEGARDAQTAPEEPETVGKAEGSGGAKSGREEAVVFGPMTEAEAQARGLPDAPVETPAEPRQELRDAQKAPNVGDSVGTAEQSEGAESGREEAVVFGPMTEAEAQATPLPDAPVATSVLSQEGARDARKAPNEPETVERAEGSGGAES
ncbi:putative proteophosphoglycan ppg4, related protein, partial [Toxoplasma gondii GT1]